MHQVERFVDAFERHQVIDMTGPAPVPALRANFFFSNQLQTFAEAGMSLSLM